MTPALASVVLIPLFAGITGYLIEERMRRYGAAAAALLTLAGSCLVTYEVWISGPVRYELAGWQVPLTISLYADGFSIFMILMTGIIGCFVAMFASGYYRADNTASTHHEGKLFWALFFFLWAAMNGLFVAADIFNIYVVFEIMGLAAISLITLSANQEALRAAMRYLIAAFIGSLSFLMGVALLYAEHGVLDMQLLGGMVTRTPATLAAFSLMAGGLILKTALFPMHFWLPPAHSNAAPPVSALLSAVVVKGSFFILARLWFDVFYDIVLLGAGQLLGALGCAAILWGSFEAIRQRRLKLLIAHSTVAQIGYMFLVFPLTAMSTDGIEAGTAGWLDEATIGTVYQVLSHGLAKSALFLGAGLVMYSYKTDNIRAIRGLSHRMPVTTFAIALSGMSLIGLPPSSGFIAKFLILKAALGSGQWWWVPVIAVGGLLTAGYVVLILRYAFETGKPGQTVRKVPRYMEIAALSLAVLAVLAGFRLQEPLDLLLIGEPFPFETGIGGTQ